MEVILPSKSTGNNSHFNNNNHILKISKKILGLASKRSITLRLMGGMGIWFQCPNYRYLLSKNKRKIHDIDFVGRLKEIIRVQDLFSELGFIEDKNIARLFGRNRRIFDLPNPKIHIDLVLDKLHFCHDIDLRTRLDIDSCTVSLSDLILSKLQIVQINRRDILDVIILLLEHKVSDKSLHDINGDYIAKLCSNDWGLWKTVTMNLKKVANAKQEFVDAVDLIKTVNFNIQALTNKIQIKKKGLRWKSRSILGERKRWYNEVEELNR